uniref:Cilia- and flagella-associated protein 157 n=1 Tax=Mola mola TaxID=94237 RepID=A0A3Q3X8Z4_MOLML
AMPRKKERKTLKLLQHREKEHHGAWHPEDILVPQSILHLFSSRYQQKCDELERQVKDLTSQFSTLETEKKDVVEYLKRSLLVKEDEVDELTERLEGQQLAANKDREALQLQHSQQRQELQDRIEELTAENETLGELDALEEFKKKKEQLILNLASLEQQLVDQEEEHKDAIHNLEMKVLMEQTRLEKEIQSQVEVMAAEVHRKVNQRIPEVTRLALEENTEVKARLSQLSEHALVLMEENYTLQDRKSQLSVDVENLEGIDSFLHPTSFHQEVEQLQENCQQLQEELTDCQQDLEQLQTKHIRVLAEMEALRSEFLSCFYCPYTCFNMSKP